VGYVKGAFSGYCSRAFRGNYSAMAPDLLLKFMA